jgi:hypothetical protein
MAEAILAVRIIAQAVCICNTLAGAVRGHYGLLLLVPAMAAVGLSGRRLAGSSTAAIIQRKQRRMVVIAANGLLVLLPCALTLAWLAAAGDFGSLFYAVQGIELLAGGVNIMLLLLNMRLGLQMTRRDAQA